jgi:hypothetical protein
MAKRHFKALSLVAFLGLAACGSEEPPAGGKDATSPGTDSGNLLCDPQTPCPNGFDCNGGVCEPTGASDAGTGDASAPRARIEVCTPDGCQEPHRLSFGGSRIGAQVSRNLTIRSTGDIPLEIFGVNISGANSEFTTDPAGNLSITLNPGEETVVRVSHAARDGQADTDRVEIISNADKARVLVDISTEYKGIPTLFVGDQPAGGSGVSLTTLDFGNVRAGVRESRVIYLKNRDNIVDGSVLGVTELRTDPLSSSNFTVSANRGIPAYVNQFNTMCATTANCAGNPAKTFTPPQSRITLLMRCAPLTVTSGRSHTW